MRLGSPLAARERTRGKWIGEAKRRKGRGRTVRSIMQMVVYMSIEFHANIAGGCVAPSRWSLVQVQGIETIPGSESSRPRPDISLVVLWGLHGSVVCTVHLAMCSTRAFGTGLGGTGFGIIVTAWIALDLSMALGDGNRGSRMGRAKWKRWTRQGRHVSCERTGRRGRTIFMRMAVILMTERSRRW